MNNPHIKNNYKKILSKYKSNNFFTIIIDKINNKIENNNFINITTNVKIKYIH